MSNVCLKRLQKELVAIKKNPVQSISAAPNDNNLLEWHYVIEGPKDTVYEGGYYHGILVFPKDYPYKPPAIKMFTTNGRFRTNFRLCLSMSDYHPETWNPMWSVASILQGLLSFMVDDQATLGSIEATSEARRKLAKASLRENLKNPTFCRLFPQYLTVSTSAAKEEDDEQQEEAAVAPKEEEAGGNAPQTPQQQRAAAAAPRKRNPFVYLGIATAFASICALIVALLWYSKE